VHSMVEFADGAFLAQLGAPDMRVPILYALSRGEHRASGVAPFDPLTMGSLDFEAPDAARYPCLNLAIRAGEAGGAASVVLNASNEVAVAAVLAEELSFVEIPAIIEACLESQDLSAVHSVDAALERDAITRAAARKLIAGRARNRT